MGAQVALADGARRARGEEAPGPAPDDRLPDGDPARVIASTRRVLAAPVKEMESSCSASSWSASSWSASSWSAAVTAAAESQVLRLGPALAPALAAGASVRSRPPELVPRSSAAS
jgi:hypothetical protein